MIMCMGFDGFYGWMNKTYPDNWVLVGGAACWAYFEDARKIDRCSAPIYDKIFPEDIDVIVNGQEPSEPVAVYADGRHLDVEFVADMIDRAERCRSANKLRSGARALDIPAIIFKYSTTSTKSAVRQTRVKFLEAVNAGILIMPDELERFYSGSSSRPANPFLAALQARKKE